MALPPAESPLRLRGRDIARNQVLPRPRNQSLLPITQEHSPSSGIPGFQSQTEVTGMMSWSISYIYLYAQLGVYNKKDFPPMVFLCLQ
jgi:hypothetical protein